jgi:hypothetical protein
MIRKIEKREERKTHESRSSVEEGISLPELVSRVP